tara:strand:+ start:1711 stop:1908 length:198 start_codon:yes stop_codon:yes gene_type:complete
MFEPTKLMQELEKVKRDMSLEKASKAIGSGMRIIENEMIGGGEVMLMVGSDVMKAIKDIRGGEDE